MNEYPVKRFPIIILTVLLIIINGPVFSEENGRYERHQARIILPRNSNILPAFSDMPRLSKSFDFSDLKISETISPATFSQKNSDIVVLGGGAFIIVWQDNRIGSYGILAQKFDSAGNALGNNVLLVGRDDGYDIIEPKVAPNGIGGFYLAWREVGTGKIYVSGYDSQLNQSLSTFVVNDIPAGNFAGPYDLDSYQSSRLAVVWEDYGLSNDISLRFFSSAGTALSGVIKINDDTEPAAHWTPTLAFDDPGDVGVAWEDYRAGNADIYFQLVNSDGSLNGTNLGIVAGQFDDSAQYLPEIAFSSRDGFALGWLDRRDGNQKVYLQRYVAGVGLEGGNVQISIGTATDWDISMAVTSAGNLDMVWSADDSLDYVYMQKFTTDFSPTGASFSVNMTSDGSRWGTSAAIGIIDRTVCSWTDFRFGHGDIFFQYLTAGGSSLLADDKLVNDDTEGAFAREPHLAPIDGNTCAAVFTDSRNDAGDIYLQIFSDNGSLIGSNAKINSGLGGTIQNEPALAAGDSGLLIVWNDGRPVLGSSGQRIFGRFADLSGNITGDEFVLSDSTDATAKSNPRTALLPDMTAMVVWIDHRMGNPQIFAQLLDSSGALSGSAFMVSNNTTDFNCRRARVGADAGGNFTVVWLADDALSEPGVHVARYGSGGVALDRFNFVSPLAGIDIVDIGADIDPQGNIYVIWEGDDGNLYITARTAQNDVIVSAWQQNLAVSETGFIPDLAVDTDRSVAAVWLEEISGKRRAYYRIFNAGMSAQENGFVSSNDQVFMIDPAVSVGNNIAWLAWVDPRDGGLNIYGRAVSYVPTGVDDGIEPALPHDFNLYQNHPNPFNPQTTIDFTVTRKTDVTIAVYNILGEKVAILADRSFEAGRHTVIWDGRDDIGREAASGIYLYRMVAGDFSAVRKMLLIK